MSESENKAVVRRVIEEIAVGGNVGLADELVDPAFVNHTQLTGDITDSIGIEPYKQEVKAFLAAFSDRTAIIDDMLTDGDKVIVRFRLSGTHNGEFAGILPTGKTISDIATISIVRLSNGKLVERWSLTDRLTMMQQLGVILTPEESGQ